MNDTISEIRNYILFLQKEINLEISLHPFGNEQFISNSDLISFQIHANPYCIFIKTFSDAWEHCISCQTKVFDKSSSGSFCGTCYAGVFEYVYPIKDADSTMGFISVSGYRSKNYESYIERCSQKFKLRKKELEKNIMELKDNIPDKVYVDTLIAPLTRMFELAYKKTDDLGATKKKNTITEIIKHVNRHYPDNITLEQLSKLFLRSPSFISHSFKKQTGMTFSEYLVDVRIRSAKNLLIHSNLNISEIAFSVGFNDSNYFSNVFKKHTGLSPRKYKQTFSENPENIEQSGFAATAP